MERRHFLYNAGCGIIGAVLLPGQVLAEGNVGNKFNILDAFFHSIEASEYHDDSFDGQNQASREKRDQLLKMGYKVYRSGGYIVGSFLLQPLLLKANETIVDFIILVSCKNDEGYQYSGQLTSGFIGFCVKNKQNLVAFYPEESTYADIILPTGVIAPKRYGTLSFMTKNGHVHVNERVDNLARHTSVQIDKENKGLWESVFTTSCTLITC